MEENTATVETRDEKFQRLLRLEQRLAEIKADKKRSMRVYSEEIKLVQSEIKEVVEELGGQ